MLEETRLNKKNGKFFITLRRNSITAFGEGEQSS